jgi:DNA end-binding protein Ku
MRAIWSGEIAFGLVTIPAKLYSATKDLTPQFHQLHKECGTRIQLVRRCPKCNRDLPWDEIGKGYEVNKGEYALFTKEELAKIEEGEGAGGIDIAEFIELKDVDLAYIEKSYWVGPGGKSAHSYALLRTVLEQSGRVALARVKIRTRTRLALLRPRGLHFSLDMMRFADELVKADEIVIPAAKPVTDRELALAASLVDQLTGPFDPAKHPDEYRAAVHALVDEKVEADQITRDSSSDEGQTASAGGAKVIDLAELLAASLKRVDRPGPVKTSSAEAAGGAAADTPEKRATKKVAASKNRATG